jgi:hypothetical protein
MGFLLFPNFLQANAEIEEAKYMNIFTVTKRLSLRD